MGELDTEAPRDYRRDIGGATLADRVGSMGDLAEHLVVRDVLEE